MKTKKKGFTIVELVIVIAVIAILAAVLIPTFSGIIKKANESTDTQLVRNLNSALALDNKEHKTMQSALDAAKEFGFDLDKINTKVNENEILWDSVNDCFVYLNGGSLEYIPDSKKTDDVKKYQLWKIANELPDSPEYSVYAGSGWTATEVTGLTVGFDAGENTEITNVEYVGVGTAQDVVIRTNGNTKVNVKATNDNVTLYGKGTDVNGESVSNNSLHIRGTFINVYITNGRVVFEQEATCNTVTVLGEGAIVSYSEAFAIAKYPRVQRLSTVKTYKVQETKSDDGTKISDGTVAVNDNGTVTVDGDVKIEIKENHGATNNTIEQEAIEKSALFAGGLGTEAAPYLLASDEQFANIQKLSDANDNITGNFELIDDVYYAGDTMYYLANSTFDGNGYKLTFKGSTGGWPSLFCGTKGVCEIKNINYECDGLVMSLVARANCTAGSNSDITTFENITVTSTTDDIIPTWDYGCSAFTYSVYNNSTVYFKDCVVDMNYSVVGGEGYAGIFIGNYALPNSYVSFENCVNKGTVSAISLGFFTGNTCNDVTVSDSSTPTFNSKAATFYISNCSNQGTMIGASAVSSFGCNSSSYVNSHKTANDSLTGEQMYAGVMVVGNVEIGLAFDGNKFTIVGSDDNRVNYYAVGYSAAIKYTDGTGRFSFAIRAEKSDVASGKAFATANIVTVEDYEKAGGNYESLGEEKQESQYGYKIADNADGSITIVVNTTNHKKFISFEKVEYSVSAYTSEGVRMGYKNYKK